MFTIKLDGKIESAFPDFMQAFFEAEYWVLSGFAVTIGRI